MRKKNIPFVEEVQPKSGKRHVSMRQRNCTLKNNFQVSKGQQTAGRSSPNGGEKQLNPPPRCFLYISSLGILLLRPVK